MSTNDQSDFPRITVILPIRNEERFIARTISFLQQQDYPKDRLEILVVDGQSEDRTASIVAKLAEDDTRIRLIHNPGSLPPPHVRWE